jgi:monoamine oxidase
MHFFTSTAASRFESKQNQDEVVKEIRNTLQKMFPDKVIPLPVGSYTTNWNQDSFSYGSYSYISVMQNYEDPLYLAEPINNRLLFSGEATSTDTYGYAHGALLSARREVTRLLFVYDLLSEQNSTTSLEIFVTISFIVLQFFFLSFM